MTRLVFAAAVAVVFFTGCFETGDADMASPKKAKAHSNGLTEFEMEHGIGPVTAEFHLGLIDKDLAAAGQQTFETKCYSCHRLDTKLVGPPLKEITKKRKPEYIVNMMLNPDGMLAKHPEARKLLRQYLIVMTCQNISRADAMAILEYFRKAGQENTM